jgi:hypothetical protein
MKVLLTSLLRDTGSISAVVSSSPTSNDGRTRGVGASGVTKCLASSKYATRVLYQTLRYDHLSIMNGETLLCLTNARYLLPLKSFGKPPVAYRVSYLWILDRVAGPMSSKRDGCSAIGHRIRSIATPRSVTACSYLYTGFLGMFLSSGIV